MTPGAAALLQRVAAAFPRGPFVVALSGGADSSVLAWLGSQLPEPAAPRAVFVHHGWAASDRMQAAAEAVAERLGLALEVVTVAATTTEGDARALRLAALERTAGGDPIATGHHGDDLAETTLLNMARGAGAAGRAGIPHVRGAFFRPLLGEGAAELRVTATELGLPFADDPANASRAHPRNVIRHEVVPRLETAVPGARSGLVRSAALAASDDDLLEAHARRVPVRTEPDAVSFPAAAVRTLPAPVAARVVRRALRLLRPPYAGDQRQVEAVCSAATGPPCDLGEGLRVEREGPLLTVIDTTVAMPRPVALPLPVPGTLRFGRHCIHASIEVPHPVPVHGRQAAAIDAGLAADLILRTAETGERIDIGTGHKLVSDALSEAGIPRRMRTTWPLLVARGKIAWIAGVRLALWARPSEEARQVLQLTTEMRGCSTT